MAVIVHLSDLHLGSAESEQEDILRALPRALAALHAADPEPPSLLAITGDVFDTATIDAADALQTLGEFLGGVRGALGAEVPAVIIPGNHDRRKRGLFGPHRNELFSGLGRNPPPRTFIHGASRPFLSAVVPQELHGLPAAVVAYDSTYLASGWIGAGGVMRQEDLLRAAAELLEMPRDLPVILLLHHHLVPTPLTDLGAVAPPAGNVLRWGLERLLPELIANADREELTMTALGAGTALSTLHTLGRAVLVLHGHKHYATARLLTRTVAGHGDVLIVSAGSAGLAEPWNPSGVGDVARLWPSFNVLRFAGGALDASIWSFGYKGRSSGQVAVRPLARVRQEGARWAAEPVRLETRGGVGPTLRSNESTCRLLPNRWYAERWDYVCARRIEVEGASPRRYLELVEGARDARLEMLDDEGRVLSTHAVPSRIELDVNDVTHYRVVAAVCRTAGEAEQLYGRRASPYEWIGLMNRYASRRTQLTLLGLGPTARQAFASVTDLGTGLEEPAPLERDAGDELRLVVEDCPPRALLRIYWPLVEV